MREKIIECAEGFEAIWQLAEPAFTRAKNARFAYEQRRAREHTAILDEIAKTGEKKPTDEAIKAMVTVLVAEQQKEARDAEAALEAIKLHYQLIRDTLSAYQTAAKLESTEQALMSAGAYGS